MRTEDHFRWAVTVYYEDTDAGGVVYYANYLKYMERARTEWLRQMGFEQDRLKARDGVLFAVRSASVEYHGPARLDDRLEVSARLLEKGRSSMVIGQDVSRIDAGGAPLCTGRIQVVCVDAESWRPRSIPENIARALTDEY